MAKIIDQKTVWYDPETGNTEAREGQPYTTGDMLEFTVEGENGQQRTIGVPAAWPEQDAKNTLYAVMAEMDGIGRAPDEQAIANQPNTTHAWLADAAADYEQYKNELLNPPQPAATPVEEVQSPEAAPETPEPHNVDTPVAPPVMIYSDPIPPAEQLTEVGEQPPAPDVSIEVDPPREVAEPLQADIPSVTISKPE